MIEKVMIMCKNNSNILELIVNFMDTEKIEYCVVDKIDENLKDITKIIHIGKVSDDTLKILKNKDIPVILINDSRDIVKEIKNVNYIITNLVNDNYNYSDVQKEYLLKKGVYHVFIDKLNELLEKEYNGMIYDLTELKMIPDNWIFSFDSINDTYSWLLRKNNMLPSDFVRKVVNFYDEKVYDDSLREINYLTDKLKEIKEGRKMIDLFICNREELEIFKKNYFFKLLIKNISSTYKFYLIDKDSISSDDTSVILKLMDGVAIYNDCIYRDTYDNEFSLGYVDCNDSTIEEYNNYFDFILEKYGKEIRTESDLDEF